jgi:ribonuclease HI
MMKEATLFCDGGARGNPGPAGAGAVLYGDQQLVEQQGRYIGQATNNIAEYKGLLLGLEMVMRYQVRVLHIRLDSELVVKQIQGSYKVKHPSLIPLWHDVKAQLSKLATWDIAHVPRAQNKPADLMVNQAIDQAMQAGSI